MVKINKDIFEREKEERKTFIDGFFSGYATLFVELAESTFTGAERAPEVILKGIETGVQTFRDRFDEIRELTSIVWSQENRQALCKSIYTSVFLGLARDDKIAYAFQMSLPRADRLSQEVMDEILETVTKNYCGLVCRN